MAAKQLALALALVATASAAPADDTVLSLPGWSGDLPSAQFSGYLDLPSTSNDGTKHLHYWMVESEGNPEVDPVVFWFNGGPGCSSLDGYLYEHGPFHVDPTDFTKLTYNNATWAKKATMVYLEAPAGVGFSYSDDSADYVTNDDKTATDNRAAVEQFFALFPEYAAHDLFITGESYAGIYVPTLAEAIVQGTIDGTYTGAPLKGIAVGNGCSGDEIGTCGWGSQSTYYETKYLTGHAFVSNELKETIDSVCDWSVAINNTGDLSAECDEAVAKMHAQVGNINIYNVFGECVSGSVQEKAGREVLRAPRKDAPWAKVGSAGPNACIDSIAATAWINQPEVIKALHVVPQSFDWAICGNQIDYSSTRPNLPRDTYPLLNEHIRVLIYNGDWDACVPYTDNEAWTEGMGYPKKDAWHAWSYNGQQVGGYATVYDTPNDFTFITVRGGRHEVPETQPERAMAFFTYFLDGTPF